MRKGLLLIIGTGGLAREMMHLARTIEEVRYPNLWPMKGFVASEPPEKDARLMSLPIFGDDEWLLASDCEPDVLCGIGYPEVRARVMHRYLNDDRAYLRLGHPNFIDPSVLTDWRDIKMGIGNAIAAGCILTCDIRMRDFNLLNLGVTVGHDVEIGSYCVVNPGVNLSGYVKLGDRVLVGTGAQILEHVSVGRGATIGAGAVVTKDVPAGETWVGVPARPLAARQSG